MSYVLLCAFMCYVLLVAGLLKYVWPFITTGQALTQLAFICSLLTIGTLEQGVKYVQIQQ